MYALYEDAADAADLTAAMLDAFFPGWKGEKEPEHVRFTNDTGYSPNVWKCTRLHEQLYEMGLCSIRMEEKNT